MKTIWKFPLRVDDEQMISMPDGAALLYVQTQGEVPCLWAVVDSEAPRVDRRILMRGTGHPLQGNEGRSLGGFQLWGGKLVYHAFEAKT